VNLVQELRELVVCGGKLADEGGVPVAHHDRAAERAHAGERLRRLGPHGDVAEADELLHALPLELAQDGLERRQVPVEVGDQPQPHPAYDWRALSSCSRRIFGIGW
jgi:hypothetical protein